MFVVSLERSVSEVHRTHTGVITAVTAGGHASLTMTALHLSVMQMYTRAGTVKAEVALMRPTWLTSWHCCWMHKCLQICRAAMSCPIIAWIIAKATVGCINAEMPVYLKGKQEFSDYYFCMLTAVEELVSLWKIASRKNVFKIKAFL